MQRYILQQSAVKPDYLVCTDTENGIVATFRSGLLWETLEVSYLGEEPNEEQYDRLLFELGEWLYQEHRNEAFGADINPEAVERLQGTTDIYNLYIQEALSEIEEEAEKRGDTLLLNVGNYYTIRFDGSVSLAEYFENNSGDDADFYEVKAYNPPTQTTLPVCKWGNGYALYYIGIKVKNFEELGTVEAADKNDFHPNKGESILTYLKEFDNE